MDPKDVLQTGQVYSANRIGMMLARHGFVHKRTTGSHMQYVHTAYPDKIIALVQGTKTTVYQRQAAQMCLDIQALNNAPNQNQTPQDQLPTLPDGMEFALARGTVYVRSIKNPILGFEYISGEQLTERQDMLAEMDSLMDENLDDMRTHSEFVIARNPNGSIHITHPVYPIEEIFLPFGENPNGSYPFNIMQEMVNYAQTLDHYLRITADDIEVFADILRIQKTKISPQLVQYSIASGHQYQGITPVNITLTNGGRMSLHTALDEIALRREIDITVVNKWQSIGFNFAQLPNDKCRVTHAFMDIDFEMDSLESVHTQIKETIDIISAAASTIDDHAHLGEQIHALWDKKIKSNDLIGGLNTIIQDFNKDYFEDFDAQSERLKLRGYTRHFEASNAKDFAKVTFKNKDKNFPDLVLPFVNLSSVYKSVVKNVQITPYPSMIKKMQETIDFYDRASRPQAPKKQPVHALMNTHSLGVNIGTPKSNFTPTKQFNLKPK